MNKSKILTILLIIGLLISTGRLAYVLYNKAPDKQAILDVKQQGISSKEGKELYQMYISYMEHLKDTMSDKEIKESLTKRYPNSKDYRKNLIGSIAKENFDLPLEDLNTITEEVYNIVGQ